MFSSPSGTQSTLSYYDIGSATLIAIKDLEIAGNSILVNAAGYSNTQNVFWAVRAVRNPPKPGIGPFPDEIVRVDSAGNVNSIGAPVNLAQLGYTDFLTNAGAVQGNVMYVLTKVPANHVFQIDIDPSSATFGHAIGDTVLSRASGGADGLLNIGDWDFNDADGQLYGVELSGGKRNIIKVDPASGVVTTVVDLSAQLPDSDNYGAVFMEDGPSNLYVTANNAEASGQSRTFTVRLDYNPPVVQSLGVSTSLRINDGADCLLATDFGDAPETYKTSTLGGGPAHVMSQVFDHSHRFSMGASVDSDIDGFPNDTADTDDLNIPNENDEDAVPAGTYLNQNAPQLPVKIVNNTGKAGLLAGWIDLNTDGTFTEDELATAQVPASDSTVNLAWAARSTSQVRLARDTSSMLRLRLYADQTVVPSPVGWVDGGEVEDHLIELGVVAQPPVTGPPPVQGGQPPADPPGGSGPDGTPAGATATDGLPSTGTPIAPLAAAGLASVALGFAVLGTARLARRVRRTQHTSS